MSHIGCGRAIKVPKGLCDDWKQKRLFLAFSGKTLCLNIEEKFPSNFFYMGSSYFDCKSLISLPEEALTILGVKFGDPVVLYKKPNESYIYIRNPSNIIDTVDMGEG